MCLSHTTGLPNWGSRFMAEPGTRFKYSGEGIRCLGRTVAALMPDRLWCLEALGYQRYDSPERVLWVESAARRALQQGRLAPAAAYLETLLELRPRHPWAGLQLRDVRSRQAASDHPTARRG